MVRKYRRGDIGKITPHQYYTYSKKAIEQNEQIICAYPSYTYENDDNIVGCAGVIPAHQDRYIAWAVLDKKSGSHMLPITRQVGDFLQSFDVNRIEMHVIANNTPGKRWAEMLGFRCETPEPMKKFTIDGDDCYLYAKVKHG